MNVSYTVCNLIPTYKCNNNCIFCSTILDPKKSDNVRNNISCMMEQLNKIGPRISTIILTGGEPTIYPNIIELLKKINKNFPKTTIEIQSNGRMLHYAQFTEKLSSIKNLILRIAFHSHDEKIFDNLTGVEGSFEQTKKGIINGLLNKIKILLNVVLNKQNYVYLPETASYIIENFSGIEGIYFKNIELIRKGFLRRDELSVKYKEIMPYLEKSLDIFKKKEKYIELQLFPLCVLKEKHRKFAIKKARLVETFFPVCDKCSLIDKCQGIEKTYAFNLGLDEFIPILSNGKTLAKKLEQSDILDSILIEENKCTKCGECKKICPTHAINPPHVNEKRCILCNACMEVCKEGAISRISTGKGAFSIDKNIVVERY